MAVKIDVSTCIGCGVCVSTCPVEALSLAGDKVTVNDDCIDCGACVGDCPVSALSL